MSANSRLLGVTVELGVLFGVVRGAGACGSREEQRKCPHVSGVIYDEVDEEVAYGHPVDFLHDSVSPWMKREWRCLAELL